MEFLGPSFKLSHYQISGRLAAGGLDLGLAQGRLDNSGDADRDLILQVEHVFKRQTHPYIYSHGFSTVTAIGSKSARFRVTTIR
jgi:hypothetical protein